MADNLDVTPGTGATVAADEIAGALHQRVKITVGADGTNDGDVSGANPLPVDVISALPAGANAIGKLAANSGVDIGDVDVTSCALPTGASTAAKQGIAGTDLVGGAGAVAAGVQRVTLASDDPAVTDLAALEVLATSIDADTDAIKTAVESLDNAVDGNYLNTNMNIAGTDVDGNSGNKSAQTQRVCVATDDVNLSAIKTAVEVIDNAIDGTEMQVDVVAALPAGTNNIGDVDVLSMASGKTIKRAVISGATSGNNTIVAAVADKKIKVLSVCLVAVTAVTVRFESGADGTALTGVMSIGATGGFVLPAPPDPSCHWFETGVNTLLNMELGGAVQVSGCITYYEEA
jgi:hypothetical protein